MNYKKSLESIAELAPDYKANDRSPQLITQYANHFCEATDTGNEAEQDIYIACLTLKLWNLANNAYAKYGHSLKLSLDDFISWLQSAILEACADRVWKTKDISAAQAIAQKYQTRYVAMANYESNLHIHKANYGTYSMDVELDDNGNTMLDTLQADDPEDLHSNGYAMKLVQDLLDRNKIVDAIIVDTIISNDCEKHEKKTIKEINADGSEYKYSSYTREFSQFQVVKNLNNLPDDFEVSFAAKYLVNKNNLSECVKIIKACKNQKLYEYLRATLENLREELNIA